jgi:hypothetical protein
MAKMQATAASSATAPSSEPAAKPEPRVKGGPSLTPLDFFLKVMRNSRHPYAERKWAAQQAAPYIHARLGVAPREKPAVEEEDDDTELRAMLARFE